MEGLEGCLASGRTVRSLLVVVDAECIELKLQVGEVLSGSLAPEEELEGEVEALHLAAGLRVIRAGVGGDNAQTVEF